MLLSDLTAAVKDIMATAPADHISEARSWAADCEQYEPGDGLPPIPYAVGYVVRYYEGGWDAFVAECCVYVYVNGGA